jgi:hypothetical protein
MSDYKSSPGPIVHVKINDLPRYLAFDADDDIVLSREILRGQTIINYTRKEVLRMKNSSKAERDKILEMWSEIGGECPLVRCDELKGYILFGPLNIHVLEQIQKVGQTAPIVITLEKVVGALCARDEADPENTHRAFLLANDPSQRDIVSFRDSK